LVLSSQLHSIVLFGFGEKYLQTALFTQIMGVFCQITQNFSIKKDSAPHLTGWCYLKIIIHVTSAELLHF